MSISFERQRGILDPDTASKHHVTICGLGTVGSNAAVQLAKLGVMNFTLIDFDVIERHNIPSQAFDVHDLGRVKAEACREAVKEVSPSARVKIITDPLKGYEWFDTGIVILAVDSISLRRKLFETCVRHRLHSLMIDVRMNANNMQMWAIEPNTEEELDKYRGTLHSSAENVSAPCGGRTFAPVGAMSGAMIAQTVTKMMNSIEYAYYTYFDMDSMTLATA